MYTFYQILNFVKSEIGRWTQYKPANPLAHKSWKKPGIQFHLTFPTLWQIYPDSDIFASLFMKNASLSLIEPPPPCMIPNGVWKNTTIKPSCVPPSTLLGLLQNPPVNKMFKSNKIVKSFCVSFSWKKWLIICQSMEIPLCCCLPPWTKVFCEFAVCDFIIWQIVALLTV